MFRKQIQHCTFSPVSQNKVSAKTQPDFSSTVRRRHRCDVKLPPEPANLLQVISALDKLLKEKAARLWPRKVFTLILGSPAG